MSNSAETTRNIGTAVSAKPFGLQLGSLGFSIACFIVIHGISLGVWRLFADPKVGIWNYYPQPFGAYLFWAILVVVFIGFNLGMHGFSKLSQPMGALLPPQLPWPFALPSRCC